MENTGADTYIAQKDVALRHPILYNIDPMHVWPQADISWGYFEATVKQRFLSETSSSFFNSWEYSLVGSEMGELVFTV